jgi:aminomuconate-semialdehyde/2-hydroxymuconate-6-semialdehyde dehydrogenase
MDLSLQVMPDIVRSFFTNQGEICLCSSRIYVQQGIFDKFVEKLAVIILST